MKRAITAPNRLSQRNRQKSGAPPMLRQVPSAPRPEQDCGKIVASDGGPRVRILLNLVLAAAIECALFGRSELMIYNSRSPESEVALYAILRALAAAHWRPVSP